jgi:hypothetical protein
MGSNGITITSGPVTAVKLDNLVECTLWHLWRYDTGSKMRMFLLSVTVHGHAEFKNKRTFAIL